MKMGDGEIVGKYFVGKYLKKYFNIIDILLFQLKKDF